MSRIKSFQQYFLNEAEDPMAADPAAAPDAAATPDAAAEGEGVENKNLKDALVVGKDFFGELDAHITYWFSYTKLSKTMKLDKKQKDADKITFWASEPERDFLWKVTIRLADVIADVEKIEDLFIDIHLYKGDAERMLRKASQKITVEDLSSKNLASIMGELRRNVIHAPSDKADTMKFNRKETDNLTDEIY